MENKNKIPGWQVIVATIISLCVMLITGGLLIWVSVFSAKHPEYAIYYFFTFIFSFSVLIIILLNDYYYNRNLNSKPPPEEQPKDNSSNQDKLSHKVEINTFNVNKK